MIRMPTFSFVSDLAVDAGTANTLIYERGKGIVLDEPTVVACRQVKGFQRPGRPLAFGGVAKQMVGREPSGMCTVRPISRGIVTDSGCASGMLRRYLDEVAAGRSFRWRPRVVVCVPTDSNGAERRAMHHAVRGAGAGQVNVVDKIVAAAVGAGLPIRDAGPATVLDIGAGTSEIGVFALGQLVCADAAPVGGEALDAAIVRHVEATRGVLVGPNTAERIKQQLADPCFGPGRREITVAGFSRKTGRPQVFTIGSEEIAAALWEPLDQIMALVGRTLQKVPGELRGDLATQGIVLAGGGALLRNLGRVIAEESGFPCRLAQDPLTCAVRGAGQILERRRDFRDFLREHGS